MVCNMKFILSVLFPLFLLVGYSQECPKRYVVDSLTNEPLYGVHVFTSPKEGVFTDIDGSFKFCTDQQFINFSYIGYETKQLSNEGLRDTVRLSLATHKLGEITVRGLSAVEMLHSVIDSLQRNYYVEPIQYEVYVRNMILGQDKEELLVFSEFLIDTYINEKSKTYFWVLKARARSLSKKGDFYMKDMRMINPISTSRSHLLPDDSYSYFIKKKTKNFTVSFENSRHAHLIKLRVQSKKENYYLILLISNRTHAIEQITWVSTKLGTKSITTFKEIDDKWYLAKNSSFGKAVGVGKRETRDETVAIFKIRPETNYSRKEFKSYMGIVVVPVEPYNKDWDDPVWERFSDELPPWVKKAIEGAKK